MGYVDRILQPGERRLYSARIHWVVYVPGLLLCILGFLFWAIAKIRDVGGLALFFWDVLAILAFAVGFLWLFWSWFDAWTTEIEVTDRRIIFKRGFIRRETQEINMDKIESVGVDQSILGRLLDYGAVTLHGTGAGIAFKLPTIAAPLDFRNHVTAR